PNQAQWFSFPRHIQRCNYLIGWLDRLRKRSLRSHCIDFLRPSLGSMWKGGQNMSHGRIGMVAVSLALDRIVYQACAWTSGILRFLDCFQLKPGGTCPS